MGEASVAGRLSGKEQAQARQTSEAAAAAPVAGMLLHIDASQHRWFCDERWYDLLVIMDDATSVIYYAQLVEEESTPTVLAALREVIEQKGVFARFIVIPQAISSSHQRRVSRWTTIV